MSLGYFFGMGSCPSTVCPRSRRYSNGRCTHNLTRYTDPPEVLLVRPEAQPLVGQSSIPPQTFTTGTRRAGAVALPREVRLIVVTYRTYGIPTSQGSSSRLFLLFLLFCFCKGGVRNAGAGAIAGGKGVSLTFTTLRTWAGVEITRQGAPIPSRKARHLVCFCYFVFEKALLISFTLK